MKKKRDIRIDAGLKTSLLEQIKFFIIPLFMSENLDTYNTLPTSFAKKKKKKHPPLSKKKNQPQNKTKTKQTNNKNSNNNKKHNYPTLKNQKHNYSVK